jgi:flagellar protein FlbD
MIRLTRLSHAPLVINADVIAYVESLPDTLITLTNGERFHVAETPAEVIELAIAYHRLLTEME